jgi:hypothetical protein
MLVIAADMSRHHPLHPFVEQGRILRLNEQVKMIRHQAPGKELDAISLTHSQQNVNEGVVVPVLVKDLLPVVSTIDQVITAIVG